jgi:hypothetical protein
MWLDFERNVNFISRTCVDNELATHGISSVYEVRNDYVGGSNSGEKDEVDVHNLERMTSFAEACAAYGNINLYL